jgi:phage tail sheath protein FI
MGTSFTYPGVYIEEISSALHSITGVATSIAAFIGWAPQGPVTGPALVESWAEYQTLFGGLNASSYLGYAVSQFFSNGGTQAYILRLVANGDSGAGTEAATASGTVGGLPLYASNPGGWGKNLLIAVAPSAFAGVGFSLTVSLVVNGTTTLLESYSNLSVTPSSAQYVVAVINNDSNYITFINPQNPGAAVGALTTPTAAHSANLTGGNDGDVLDPTSSSTEFAATLFPTSATPASPGYRLLEQVEIFNLLCVPGYSDPTNLETLQQYCAQRRAFLIVDPPQSMTQALLASKQQPLGAGNVAFSGQYLSNAAYYFPWVSAPDPLFGGRAKLCPPCGYVAGIYAATDANSGVWKAPAGINASLSGLLGLQYTLSDSQNGLLNPYAINCLRQFINYGQVVWGARTMAGADQVGSQWKYVPIRRLALYLESSLYYGTQWVVFEPNDETLWGQVRLNVGTFLQGLFLQGAFAGTTPQQAYFVKCDAENNPAASVALGVVNILVGFAPLYPAEFVVIQIQQIVSQ